MIRKNKFFYLTICLSMLETGIFMGASTKGVVNSERLTERCHKALPNISVFRSGLAGNVVPTVIS